MPVKKGTVPFFLPILFLTLYAHATVLSTPRLGESASLLPNGDILVAGGQTSTATASILASAELILPDGSGVPAGTMSVGRSSHTATVLPNGLVLVAGGVNTGGVNNTTDIYNPTTKSWTTGPNLSVPRFGHTATLLQNGKVLICGGYSNLTGTVNPSCDLYTPDMSGSYGPGTIVAGPILSTPRAFQSATLLASGGVLMAGGMTTGGSYADTTEVYNPSSNSFGAGPGLIVERAFHTATALGDGRVLIAGGKNNNQTYPLNIGGTNVNIVLVSTNEAEVYDPTSNTISPAAPMNESRREFPVTLDANGSLNVMGGWGSIPPASASYPSLSVFGSINYSGTTFANQPLTLQTPITLKLSVNTAGLISGGQVYVPPSKISFSSGTVNVDAFIISIAPGTGTCIYTPGGTPNPWVCGEIRVSSLLPLSGTITCNTAPCSSPINLNPSGTAAAMSEESNIQTPTFVVISSMAFADEEVYNPVQNTWTLNTAALAGPDALVAAPSNPPYNSAYFSMPPLLTPDDITFFIGGDQLNAGQTEIGGIQSFLIPTSGPSLPGPRAYHTATALPNGKIIIAGGQDVSTDTLSSSLLFDPTALTFTTTAPLNVTRAYHTATLLPNGNVLAAGGFNYSTGTLSSAEIYNSTGSAWTVTGSMNQASQYHTATILPDGNLIIIGGVQNGSNYLSRTEIYYSTSGIWKLAAPINVSGGIAQHAATLLQDGTILVTGGINASGPLDTTEIYNTATDSWSAGLVMPSAVYAHTATLLSDGNVLVAGGDSGIGASAASMIYNPSPKSWSLTGSLQIARLNHNAILLPDGDVLVSGGFASGVAIGSVERYVPYGGWIFGGNITSARGGHTTTLTTSGVVFDIGGLSALTGGSYLSNTDDFPFSVTPDLNTVGAPPSLRQPQINSVSLPVLLPGASVTMTGAHFHGVTEASGGGAASANSDQDKPRMILQSVDSANSFLIDLSTYIYANPANLWTHTDSSITVNLPATNTGLPYGWYQLREAANAQFSPGILVHAGPPLPTQAPGIPSATILSSAAVSWTWTAAGGTFDGYDVYEATTGVFLSTTAPSQTSYMETNLAPNTTIQLLVAAYTLSGDGPGATSGINYTFAATPLSLAISSDTGSDLLLSWDPNHNSQGTVYEVSESTDIFVNSFSTPVPTSLAYTSTQTAIQNLQMDTTYYFRVRAFNYNGIPSLGFSNIASTTTVNQVFNLSGTPVNTTSINWSWTSTSLPSGGYFAIYNATTTPEQIIATTVSPFFSDIGLSTNTPRSVQIAAFTPSGEGPLTSTTTVYTDAAVPASVNPSIVKITTSGFTGVWTTNGNPASTNYECTVTAVNLSTTVFTTLTTSSSTALYCDVTGLPLPGSSYQTQVVALNGDGVITNPLNLGTTDTYAMAPSSLTVTGTTAGSISISWSTMTNSGLDSYQITYSTDDFASNISTALSFSNGLGVSTLTISGLIGGYHYWIRAQADNPNGVVSAYSNVVSTITFNNGAPPGSSGIYVVASAQTYQTFTLGNGEAGSILIAANSFSQNTIIVISAIATSPPLCPGTGSGVGISITASPPEEPTTPITLTLSYSPSQVVGLNLSEASLMRQTAANACVPVETTINQPSDQFTAKLNHISQFELAQVPPGTSVNAALIYPNPLYPSRGNGYVTFQNLPSGARVRIYTVRGEMVFEGTADPSGLFHWPGTNRGGRLVASGVYLVYIDSKGAHDLYKVAVER